MKKMQHKPSPLALACALALAGLSAPLAAQTPATEIVAGSQGEAAPRVQGSDPAALQDARRVEVDAQVPGEATPPSFVELPGGGLLWATEDPAVAQPSLSVNSPGLVAFDGQRIAEPARFHFYSNYPDFAERYELRVFRSSDIDQVSPLATLAVEPALTGEIVWEGALPAGHRLRAGDSLLFVLRAYDGEGRFDETQPQQLQLAAPGDVERYRRNAQFAASSGSQGVVDGAQSFEQRAATTVYGQNNLRIQNILLRGSRVRIFGQDIPEGGVTINGQSVPVDLERKFVAEFLMPVGEHRFMIQAGQGAQAATRELAVSVDGRYFFMVGLADLTISENDLSGNLVPAGPDDGFDEDLLVEGRLAFYLKGKVQGRYLVTAQMDTQERELGDLFDDFLDKDPRDIFRRLDPDRYYPVYGDDSTTTRDIDSQGRLYVRVDWDKSQALWGNYQTGLDDTEFAPYVRSLYGASLRWRSTRTTALGEPVGFVNGFLSQAQTALGHSEFLGTGGSLYYLRHTDILPGSEQVALEIRDPATGRVERRIPLASGLDYEADWFQGRLTLTRPLAQISQEYAPSITRDSALYGYENRLLVDYEYRPSGFDADHMTAGFRGRGWLGEHVAIGATHVDENRAGDDYTLSGLDLTLQAGRGTYLRLEAARTEATQAPVFYSENGGLSFVQTNPVLGAREGDARAVDARVNFQELGWTRDEWTMGAWWRHNDAGYSVARRDLGLETEERGLELAGRSGEHFGLSARYSDYQRGLDRFTQAQLLLDYWIDPDRQWTGELRHVDEESAFTDGSGLLAALRYRQRVNAHWEWYGIGQATLERDGAYQDNDRLTLGARYLFGNRSALSAEASTGDRGDAFALQADIAVNDNYTLYARLAESTETTDFAFGPSVYDGLTLGQRWRASNRVNVFSESQWVRDGADSGLVHTFGMDFFPAQGWNLGFSAQSGELENGLGTVDRQALSVFGGFRNNRVDWYSKVEYREDDGVEQREQFVSTNRLAWRVNDDWRLAFRFNHADTNDQLDPNGDARFTEANAGFAYRPHESTRWALLGRYTYLYDLRSAGQTDSGLQQRSHIFALEGVYQLDDRWELGGKLSWRGGEVRDAIAAGPWVESSVGFGAAQLRYRWASDWDGLLEYRRLHERESDTTRQGWLIGVDRRISEHFRIGAGYNFTDFSDNLANLDYTYEGWFLNFVGVY